MEENIFKSYIEGYINVHNELVELDKSGENENRKQQLENALKSIEEKVKEFKEDKILQESTNHVGGALPKLYETYLQQEKEIGQKLEKFEGTEPEKVELERKLKEINKNKRIVLQQISQKSEEVYKINEEYTYFLEEINKLVTLDENQGEQVKPKKIDMEKEELLNDMIKGREKREKERYNETIQEAMEEEQKRRDQEEKDLELNIREAEENGLMQKMMSSKKPNQRLPIRSFWEIYNSTCTEHVGSFANTINKLAHMKILPAKNEDTLQQALNIPLVPFKAIIKGVSMLPNKIFGTDSKIQKMQENIDELTPAEFRVLVDKSTEVNKHYDDEVVKDSFDTDYLDPQFMKQYKVNNAYLDVVRNRLVRGNGSGIRNCNIEAQKNYDRMKELRTMGEKRWTKEQEKEYSKCVDNYQKAVEYGKKLQIQIDNFDEGAKKKSGSYRNISGWFLAKFNPDNREQNANMANLAKIRREAYEKGDLKTVKLITGDMQKNARRQTYMKGKGKNRLDVGLYSVESPVETLDKGKQNKGRLLLSNLAIATSVVGLYNQIKENIANKEIVEASSQQVKTVSVKGEAKVSDSPTASQAEEAITRQTVNAGFDKGERANLDGTNWSFNEKYHQDDVHLHAEAARVAQETEKLINQKNNIGALEKAANYYKKVSESAQGRSTEYMTNHPKFDYTAFELGSKSDTDAIVEFFKNGTVPYQTNVDIAVYEAIPDLKQGLDYNGIVMAMGNGLYQSQKQGIKDKKTIKETMKVDIQPKHKEQKVEENTMNKTVAEIRENSEDEIGG